MGKTKWHIKATYVILSLAFILGMAMLPATPSAAHGLGPNPDFEAFPREGDAPLKVRFENWYSGFTPPYVSAEWDFDCNGVIDTTLTGTHAEVMADVTWTYNLPGIYTVCLTMTDSTPPPMGPCVVTETKIGYITVLFNAWAYDENSDGVIQKMEAIHAVQDYFSQKITKAQTIEVVSLYLGQTKD